MGDLEGEGALDFRQPVSNLEFGQLCLAAGLPSGLPIPAPAAG